MDDEECQDQLINRNTSQGKSRRQVPFLESNDEDDSDESGSDEEDDLDEEDGEDEDGSSVEEEDEDDEDQGPLLMGNSNASQSTGDLKGDYSSDEEKEQCPICLNVFRDQIVGTPETCNHYFCLDCIVEWGKNANSCPVDRISFSSIDVRAHFGGEILRNVPVLNTATEREDNDDDVTYCEVCGRSDREDRLLLCDGCDAGYHMECLTPPLHSVPVDEWFCPECLQADLPQEDTEQVSEEEMAGILADVVPTTSRLRPSAGRTRAIARTRQSERVRANVNRNRISTARNIREVPMYLTSSLLDETIEAVVAGFNTAVYQRPLGPRSSTTRSKKKAGKKKTKKSKMPKGTRGVRKKRKKRVKRWKTRQTVKKKETSHSRIAKSLGLCKPTRGSSLPCVQQSVEPTLGSMRQDIGAASLSVFGNPHDLDPFDSNDDHSSSPASSLTARRRVLSRSALRSHRPVARPIPVGLSRRDVAPVAQEPEVIAEPVPDLLGSILSGQSMLMMKGSDILISRDGSLKAKKQGAAEATQNSPVKQETKAVHSESVSSNSGSSSSSETWKPFEQHTQLTIPSSGLYSLSPSPSPPPSSGFSRALDRVSLSTSLMPGTSAFRLKNAFTPRAVQVQSSAARLASKHVEPPRFNGTLHKPEPLSSSIHTPQQGLDIKHPLIPPAKRLDISELPRIPKIKKDMDHNHNNETRKHLVPLAGTSTNSLPTSCVNQLTGRGGNHQLGSINTTGSKVKSSRQETHNQSRHNAGVSSTHSSSSSTAQHSSGGIRSVGSLDVGGGGLRITISGNSSNSCRQFSPSLCDPFRASENKTHKKNTPPHSLSETKRDKALENEIYDPFEPTGSDSGSRGNSPERPGPSSVPSSTPASTESTSQSSGARVGTFRSFRFLTTHASKIGVSKLGPDFSDMSPSSKEPRVPEKTENQSPALPSFIKVDKEIKQEIIEAEENEKTPFRISCPLSGLKITSDLKSGGVRGFHFDSQKEKHISVKPEPETVPNRIIHQGASSNRVVWEMESPSRSLSLSTAHGLECLKVKTKVKEESVVQSRSRSRTRSQDRESRSASWSSEAERGKKFSSKSPKVKQPRSDRSSSSSCDRSRKKRQKEKKKKKKNLESRERKRSRSRSRSSSSHKKKKKKKRESRSSSPEKGRKRKHKHEKNYPDKEGSFRVKEKKKSKEEKRQSKSPQLPKEPKAQKLKDKSLDFRDTDTCEELWHSPGRKQKAVTCTLNVKTEFYSDKEETENPQIISPKIVVEGQTFSNVEKNISVKEEQAVELSNDNDVVKMEANSPPWSPSLLESVLPENKADSSQGPPTQGDITLLSEPPPKVKAISPQASILSPSTGPPSPKSHSPCFSPRAELVQPVSRPPVKIEADEMQWSPSHLDDFLLNELSDEVCSAGAVSPDDVDLEEAILMKREGDYKEAPLVSFSKKQAIPFLQDDGNSGDEGSGNCIDEAVSTNTVAKAEVTIGTSPSKPEAIDALLSKSKPQMKRVTWNLHSKSAEHSTQTTADVPACKKKKEEAQLASPKQTANLLSDMAVNSPTSVVSLTHESSQMSRTAVPRPMKEDSQLPWKATETPLQVFPQTLPPLPLPPVFPPYAPVSEPTVPCIIQSSGAVITQTPKPGSLATANEPKMQAASTGEGKRKSKTSVKGEKVKNEEYMKKLHMQERAVEEVKLAIKPFYQKREITKDEYKDILRKAVQKICHSKSGEINPVKVVNLVKAYVDRYKHLRKPRKPGTQEDPFIMHGSPV